MPTNMPDFSSPADAAVGWLVKDSPGEKAGLRAADRVVAVDGAPMQSWTEFQQEIRAGAGRDLSLTVERKEDGRTRTLDLVARPEGRSPDLVPKWTLGVEPAQPPVLDFVDEGSPAWEAGLRAGDRVLAVAGQPVSSWYGLWRAATWDAPGDAPLRVSAVRGDAPPFETSLRPGPLRDWNMGVSALPRWGVAGEPVEGLELGNVAPGSPAERGGLRPGDVVTKLSAVVKIGEDSKDWEADDPSWEALLATLNALAGPEIELSVRREGKGEPVALTLRPVPEPRPESIGYLGVGAQSRQEMLRMGPLEAVVPAMAAPFRILSDFVDGIRAMLLRRVSAKMVAGPIGILQATYASAKQSFGNLLNFLSLLSVNLAVVNFLPIPVTDGGHFVFLMYERWKGRRMDEALEARLQWAGLLFILAIFLFATWNDIARIVGGSFGL
jgi:regulator of sigma E protease